MKETLKNLKIKHAQNTIKPVDLNRTLKKHKKTAIVNEASAQKNTEIIEIF
jgi:hypothetical protein